MGLHRTLYTLLKVLKPSVQTGRLPGVRRVLPVLVGVVIVAAGLFGLLTLFNDRDSADVGAQTAGPGAFEEQPGDPPTSATSATKPPLREGTLSDDAIVGALALGNVVLVYGSPKPPPELEQMREDATGPFDPELAAAGQMAVLVRRPGVEEIQALAWQHRLQTGDPTDPALRDFVDFWLGKGRDG